jgi:hypothetical protein
MLNEGLATHHQQSEQEHEYQLSAVLPLFKAVATDKYQYEP